MAARGLQDAARHATICRREPTRVANAVRPCKHRGFRCCKDVRPHAPRASSAEVGARETSSIGGHSMFGSRAWSHPCATPKSTTTPCRSQPNFAPRSRLRHPTQRHAHNQRPPSLIRLGQRASKPSMADPHFLKRGVSRYCIPPQTAAVHCTYAFSSSRSNHLQQGASF
jgi:hypothetical protein